MKKRNLFTWAILLLAMVTVLSACHRRKPQPAPSPARIIARAEGTKIKSMSASWRQVDQGGKVEQAIDAKYQKKPLVVYADMTTKSNKQKIWLNSQNTYIQSKGTATNRWFKTKISKANDYAQLTDDLSRSILMDLSSYADKFSDATVAKNGDYYLTYSGHSKKLFKSLVNDTMITSVVGIDSNTIKPKHVKFTLVTDHFCSLKSINVQITYVENGQTKQAKVNVNNINKMKHMSVPTSVTKTAVDMTKK